MSKKVKVNPKEAIFSLFYSLVVKLYKWDCLVTNQEHNCIIITCTLLFAIAEFNKKVLKCGSRFRKVAKMYGWTWGMFSCSSKTSDIIKTLGGHN